MKLFAHIEEAGAKCLPFQLWLNAEIEDDVMGQVRCLIGQELSGRPYYAALNSVHILNCGARLSKYEEFLNINLCKFGGFPTIYEEFNGCCRRVCRVIPPTQGNTGYRISQFWLTMIGNVF